MSLGVKRQRASSLQRTSDTLETGSPLEARCCLPSSPRGCSAAISPTARFPWAVPALLSGAPGPHGETVTLASHIVVALAAIIGLAATVLWWKRADQTG